MKDCLIMAAPATCLTDYVQATGEIVPFHLGGEALRFCPNCIDRWDVLVASGLIQPLEELVAARERHNGVGSSGRDGRYDRAREALRKIGRLR